MVALTSTDHGSALTMMAENGKVVFRPAASSHPRKLDTVDKWTSAFHTFMAIFTARHPSRFAELLKYAETIRLAAAQFPGFGWRSYDEQFRLRQEANPSRSWAVLDMELWVTVAAAFSLLPVATTTSTASSAGKNTQSKQSSCFSFNSTNGCRWNPCKYAHRCNRCARF